MASAWAGVFPGRSGAPLDYHNWRARVWLLLLESTGPDEDHPKRLAIAGTFRVVEPSCCPSGV
jgi:hypothetical protein